MRNTLEIKEVLLPGRCARALHIIDLCLGMEFKSMLTKQDSTWKRKPVFGTDNWKQHWPHSHVDVKEWLQVTIREEAQYTIRATSNRKV